MIISELSNDINDLINIIAINKSTYNIFSQKFCWDLIFIKHNLPLSNMIYDGTSQWLVAFKKEINLKVYTNRLMEIFESKTEYLDGLYEFNLPYGLSIYYKDISFIYVLNIEGINMKEVSKICNKCSLNRLDKTSKDIGLTPCLMYIDDNKYIIKIYNPWLSKNNIKRDSYKYYIKRDNMKQIFYNILSHGVIPVDQYNGNRVKLII